MTDKWRLTCKFCGARWSDRTKLDAIQMHFDLEHPGEGIHLNTEWTGKGPAPADPTSFRENRAQRRRRDKKENRANRRRA